jgi:hypothetical protein
LRGKLAWTEAAHQTADFCYVVHAPLKRLFRLMTVSSRRHIQVDKELSVIGVH